MPNAQPSNSAQPAAPSPLSGAVGAGLVLVFLPGAALFFGMEWIHRWPGAGLPIMAIFGIMILFGALSLTSTLFARLGLHNRDEALALPTGSIRAAIALSVIVLFAIIAIMLYQSMLRSTWAMGLTEEQKQILIKEPANRPVAVLPVPCAASQPAGPTCFNVELARPPGQDASDLAKQLLVLLGTLMTSLTSFYFAARTAAPASEPTDPAQQPDAAAGAAGAAGDKQPEQPAEKPGATAGDPAAPALPDGAAASTPPAPAPPGGT